MIITSLLDTDLYKLSMQQVVFHRFPYANVRYEFRCRNKEVDLRPFANEIRREVEALCSLRFHPEELAFLRGIYYLNPGYVDSLQRFRLNPEHVQIEADDAFRLSIEGNWYQTILFEVPVLAIVNEVYFRNTQPFDAARRDDGEERLRAKIQFVRDSDPDVRDAFRFSEFGTRRRYSREWQEVVLRTLTAELSTQCTGTSNVHLAMKLDKRPYGTMAHEYLQACQSFVAVPEFQRFALETWMQEYRGDLGIALSDVVGMDAFLHDFDKLFCKAYDGCRHDSGDPFEWCEKLIAHYEQMRVDPRTKSAVFSDGLTFTKALELTRRFSGRIRVAHGIGTYLTNDFSFEPLQIVIKMTQCNGRPVAKISDSPGKTMSKDETYLAYLRECFSLTRTDV